MKVKELINILQNLCNDDADVLVSGEDGIYKLEKETILASHFVYTKPSSIFSDEEFEIHEFTDIKETIKLWEDALKSMKQDKKSMEEDVKNWKKSLKTVFNGVLLE